MPKRFKGAVPLPMDEDLRIGIDLSITRFRKSDEEKELDFPSSFSSAERAYIHRLIATYGLSSKSKGKGSSRFLTVYKKDRSSLVKSEAKLTLTDKATKIASVAMTQYPVTNKERQELLTPKDRGENNPYILNEGRDMSRAMGKLNDGIPQVPPAGSNHEGLYGNFATTSKDDGVIKHRKKLPIWEQKSAIIESILQNKVTIITGETGSGKTTQVPQYLLEYATENQSSCKIICAEPRRLAAVAMADRIATERGETVGQTVGFQIRLESRVSPRTLLTFCTNGVLLRTLMGSGPSTTGLTTLVDPNTANWALSSLATVTHIIIDEVHERDRFSDFLLTVLRDALLTYTSLKIILMSATIDVHKFMNYFVNAHHIHVPGIVYPVKELYLEDVLMFTEYTTPIMEHEIKKSLKSNNKLENANKYLDNYPSEAVAKRVDDKLIQKSALKGELEEDIIIDVDETTKNEIDGLLHDAFMKNSDETFQKIMLLIFSNESVYVPIDYMHSKTGVSALMCAALHGKIDIIEQLLASGADPCLKAFNGCTAQDFADNGKNMIAAEIIANYRRSLTSLVDDSNNDVRPRYGINADTELNFMARTYDEMHIDLEHPRMHSLHAGVEEISNKNLSLEQEEILRAYHKSFNDEFDKGIDKDLIVALVKLIANREIQNASSYHDSILVFLPGAEDIIGIHELLKEDKSLLVLMLHSQMVSLDQKKVFRPPPRGITKVILSTNIAETSITIDDIGHVIDTGKVKEKSYDSLSGVTMLKVTWISQDSAIQRKGRAGRTKPGTCYRLFSSARYSSMMKTSIPEILRTPLMELCLATKLLAPVGTPIADFLARAPDPPSFSATRAAVHDLKQIEAIDQWEDVTELGNHLLDLPIEPRLGKMVLYSVILKCLDPILTIVCCVSYKDPFILSSNPALKNAAKNARQMFSEESMSDHMALLRVFHGWQKARVEGSEKRFCHLYQVSSSTMDMITGMRTQLLGQLRASGFVRAKGYGDIRDLNRNSENWAVIKAALVGGAYPNLARYDKEAKLLRTSKESKVRIHPHSVLLHSLLNKKHGSSTTSTNNQKVLDSVSTDWFLFDEMSRAGRLALIRGVTAVSPITVAIFGGPNRTVLTETDGKQETSVSASDFCAGDTSDSECDDKEKLETNIGMIKLDDWIIFRADNQLANLMLQMRQKWGALVVRRLQCSGKPMTQVDNSIVHALVTMLSEEEMCLQLNQPVGIGQRPKAIPPPESTNLNPHTYSPRKTCNRSMNSGYSSKYTAYKEKPTVFQSGTLPQPSPVISEQKSLERNSTMFFPGNAENVENVDTSTKYFVIKATNSFALEFSLKKGLWQFGNQTERRLLKAIKSRYSVILIFSVQGSSHFQGFSSYSGRVSPDRYSELQSQGQGSGSGIQYFIDWIKKGNVPFQATKHLINLYNDRKKVQTSRDGQELDPSLGSHLCKMWDKVPHYMALKESEPVKTEAANMSEDVEKYYLGSYPTSRRIVGRYKK